MSPTLKIGLCICAFVASASTGADELGRLFFTPQQRAQQDRDFARGWQTGADTRRTLSVTGVVQKQGGPRTVWINGAPQAAGEDDDRSPSSARVAIPGQKQRVRIKVGQKVYINPAAPEQ